jgi:hypothetical protein
MADLWAYANQYKVFLINNLHCKKQAAAAGRALRASHTEGLFPFLPFSNMLAEPIHESCGAGCAF